VGIRTFIKPRTHPGTRERARIITFSASIICGCRTRNAIHPDVLSGETMKNTPPHKHTASAAANVSNLYGARCKRKSISPLKGRWPLIKKEEKNRAYLICPRSLAHPNPLRPIQKDERCEEIKGGCSARLPINFLICAWVTLIYL
jgi:hypothetical protein